MAQGRKLVWAALLAVGLWQFVLLGIFGPHGTSITLWGSYVAPWLRRLASTAPIVAVGVVTGCLLRPRRPEQLAALVAAAAALPIALPEVLPGELWSALFMFLFGGGVGLSEHSWSRALVPSVSHLFLMFWAFGLPAAAAGWVGARYWQAGNWERFWKGPGGAITRGALVVGVVALVLEAMRWELVLRPMALAMAAHGNPTGLGRPVWHVIILNLSAVSFGAVVTALLVGWRPRPVWGAFAGSGIALALVSFSLLNMVIERGFGHMGSVHVIDIGIISVAVVRMVEGAAAGIFAGKWEEDAET